MPAPNVKKIRGASHPLGTGDFTTLQAWEDWADDRSSAHQWAECYGGSDLGTFTLSGWSSTSSASEYPKIFASSGELHTGNFSRGAAIAPGVTTSVNTIGVNYAKIDGLGSTRGFHMDLDLASNMVIENCWATSEDNFCFSAKANLSSTASSGNIIRNCVAIGTNGNDVGFELGGTNMIGGKPGIQCVNCTAYKHKNSGYRIFNQSLPGFYGGADIDLRNCISIDSNGSDFSYMIGGNGSLLFNNNMSSDTSSTHHGTNNFFLQKAENIFSNPHNGISVTTTGIPGSGINIVASGDFTLRRRSNAVNNGAAISSVTRDIRGYSRPFDSNYDIGAYEYAFHQKGISLWIRGPKPISSGMPLNLGNFGVSEKIKLSVLPHLTSNSTASLTVEGLKKSDLRNLYTLGHGIAQSTLGPGSGAPPLYISGKRHQETLELTMKTGFHAVNTNVPFFTSGRLNFQSSPLVMSNVVAKPIKKVNLFLANTGPSGIAPLNVGGHIYHSTELIGDESKINIPHSPTLMIDASRPTATVGLSLHGHADFPGGPDFGSTYRLPSGVFPLFLKGPYAEKLSPIFTVGHQKIDSNESFDDYFNFPGDTSLFIVAPTPRSSGVNLNIGNFGIKRRETLFVEGTDTTTTVGTESLSFTESSLTNSASLYLDSIFKVGNISAATRLKDASGLPRGLNQFKLDPDLANTNTASLNTLGYSGITSPESFLHLRDIAVDSEGYIPKKRVALLFCESEKNCLSGPLYKFDNSGKDADPLRYWPSGEVFNFGLTASGEAGNTYKTTTRFPLSAPVGSGVARFKGALSFSASGSRGYVSSNHDPHRIFQSERRGVATSFWINKSQGVSTNVGNIAKTFQGVVGNLDLGFNNQSLYASGEWAIFNSRSEVQASGITPFNSFKSQGENITLPGGSGHIPVFNGLVPWVNTTDGLNSTPDTELPLMENRWYYVMFWVDTTLKKSFIRVASPAMGTPGQSGYKLQINPITDTVQKWNGSILSTDRRMSVGINHGRTTTGIEYGLLGHNPTGNSALQEEFLIDELIVSNKVCSKRAMEDKFNTDYQSYTKQFLMDSVAPLYIAGYVSDSAVPSSGDAGFVVTSSGSVG